MSALHTPGQSPEEQAQSFERLRRTLEKIIAGEFRTVVLAIENEDGSMDHHYRGHYFTALGMLDQLRYDLKRESWGDVPRNPDAANDLTS